MQLFSKIIDRAEKICLLGSVIAVLIIMLATNVDVILRKFTNHAIPSLYEITQDYFMVALVFLSVSYVYKRGGHLRVTLFLEVIPQGFKGAVQKLLVIFMLAYFVMMTVVSWKAGIDAWEFNEISSSALAYPLAPALFMVPLGCGITSLRILLSFFDPNMKETVEER